MTAVQATPDLTARQRKALAKAKRRQDARRKAQDAAEAKARAEDARQEMIAPSVRRSSVLMPDGEVYRHPVLEPAGVGFIHSNPIRHLMARGGESSLVRVEHVVATGRLIATCENAGATITSGVSSYGDVRGGDGSATIAMVLRQVACHAEKEAIADFLGGCWPIVSAMAVRGLTLTGWVAEIARVPPFVRCDRKVALGMLIAGLDRLVEFYARDDKPARLRSAEFSAPGRRDN